MKKFVILVLLSSQFVMGNDKRATTIIYSHDVTSSKRALRILVASESSSSNPTGYCGAGEEVDLRVLDIEKHRTLFSKKIESCLETISLADSVSTDTLVRVKASVDLEANPIRIRWSYKKGEPNIIGLIRLDGLKISYEETKQK